MDIPKLGQLPVMNLTRHSSLEAAFFNAGEATCGFWVSQPISIYLVSWALGTSSQFTTFVAMHNFLE